MKNTQIIANDAIAAGLYTAEELQNVIKTTGDLPLHTYTEWRRMGRQVKQGQRAVLICYLWKYETKHDTIHAKTDAGEDVEVNADESRYYKNKAHLFSIEQTEPAGQRPAPHVKTPAEIAAYNAMLAEQRRAAKAENARKAAEQAAALPVLPETATGTGGPKAAPATVKRTRKQTVATAAACKRMIKAAARWQRQNLSGVMEADGKYMICDGFRAVLFNADPGADLPRVAPDFFPSGLHFIQEAADGAGKAVTLPTVDDLRARIKANGRNLSAALYQIGAAWFNPQYLIDVQQALPGCTAYTPAGRTSAAYFKSADGVAIVLPCRRKEDEPKTAEHPAA